MNEDAERWLYFARDDLAAATAMPEARLFNHVCLHAQQCVEKALKAIIAERGVAPPKTHAITDLLTQMPADPVGTDRERITDLDVFYIPPRYPDALPGSLPDGLSGEVDAREALQVASDALADANRFFSTRANTRSSE